MLEACLLGLLDMRALQHNIAALILNDHFVGTGLGHLGTVLLRRRCGVVCFAAVRVSNRND